MLHEILLSLSGYPSPLLQQALQAPEETAAASKGLIFPLLSPPERALLGTLARLSELHVHLKDHTKKISSSHRSTICRAVGSAIASQHLRQFQQKIVDVEKSILTKDAGYVGGYGIVPLSSIVAEFSPWTRRLEWLWEVARFVLLSPAREKDAKDSPCTGVAVMNFLRKESYTGYVDLEEMATSLVKTAEMAWMRQLSTWILYGKLPTFGREDFFIQEVRHWQSNPSSQAEFGIQEDYVPNFSTAVDARSILFIGNSLIQIRSRSTNTWTSVISVRSDPSHALLAIHLEYLKSLTYPIARASFSKAISSIRLSISQNILSHLLPLPRVWEVLTVLQQFLLLDNGEFTVSLISNADAWTRSSHRQQDLQVPVRRLGRVDSISIKDGEATAVLNQTWSELVSLQNDENSDDDILELAQGLVRLVVERPQQGRVKDNAHSSFTSLLLPSPTQLILSLPPSSPLHLFLTPTDLTTYTSINTYLVSLRRADMHLASLWKMTVLRRCHSCSLGPPRSCAKTGARKLAEQRERTATRTRRIRPFWATASKVRYVVSELGNYLQGEVIRNSWEHFEAWLNSLRSDMAGSRPGTASSAEASPASSFIPSQASFRTSTMSTRPPSQTDPESLARAHQAVLGSLTSALLLTDKDYVKVLRGILTSSDHFVALFERLQSVQAGLDLQEDVGAVDTLADYARDEKEILAEMSRSRASLEELLTKLVHTIRNIEAKRRDDVEELDRRLAQMAIESGYTPWRGRTIDRLVMKLDFLAGEHDEDQDEDGVEDEYHDVL